MKSLEQFTAPNYPSNKSDIVSDFIDYRCLNGRFVDAINGFAFGYDNSATWHSYTEDDVSFKVIYDGQGTVVQEGLTWPVWLLLLTRGDDTKILRLDIATSSAQRWTDDGFVPGSFQDNSDLVAAGRNLRRLSMHRRLVKETLERTLQPHSHPNDPTEG